MATGGTHFVMDLKGPSLDKSQFNLRPSCDQLSCCIICYILTHILRLGYMCFLYSSIPPASPWVLSVNPWKF